jgi:hypothetical protein
MNQPYWSKKHILSLICFMFFLSPLFGQSIDKNIKTPEGSWDLEQISSSGAHQKLLLKIKYSEKYGRYFGNLTSRGETTILSNLNFSKETSTITFSSHTRQPNNFSLTINERKIEGTLESNQQSFQITGNKAEAFNPDDVMVYDQYTPTKIPEDINDLYLSSGNKASNIVLLIVQGGPFDKMQYTNELEQWNGKLHIAYVKQAQIINPTILPPDNNLSLEAAQKENLVSVEILHRVIQHFKSSDKRVLVWGVSYGAWVIQKYIAEYGIEADAISIAAGRLDIEEEIWKQGTLNQRAYDITYKGDDRIYTEMGFSYTKPLSYLLACITEERFTKSFESVDLSKLVVYQYGKKDGTVGRLNDSEIEFLKSKNVEIDVCKKCYHRQMLSSKTTNSAIEMMLKFVSQQKD